MSHLLIKAPLFAQRPAARFLRPRLNLNDKGRGGLACAAKCQAGAGGLKGASRSAAAKESQPNFKCVSNDVRRDRHTFA